MSISTTTPTTTTTTNQHTGVITRICNFKYGFLKSDDHENLFFHFSELSDDAKAFVEAGSKVTFRVEPNPNGNGKMKACGLTVISAAFENEYKNLEGTVQGEMSDRGFCMIAQGDTTTYLFHSANLVDDDASKEAGNTVTTGHRVIFDATWNHKHSPPKPFATNVRLIPGQDTLNAESSALEAKNLWQRGSKLDILLDEENLAGDSISPSGRSSISNRASALKSNGPVRRWTRTTDSATKSDRPAGGLRMMEKGCKYGRKCTRTDCWFEHPKGRQIEDGLSMSDDDSDSGSDDSAKVSSMGRASLRLLVTALVESTGNTGYLAVRNALQKPEYVGRLLTREEKSSVGDILEEMAPSVKPSVSRNIHNSARGTGRTGISRSSYANKRVSLSDLCRDPSLHSRLSAANNRA